MGLDLTTGLVALGAVALAFIASNIYTRTAALSWERTPYPPGRLLRADSTRLYARIRGQGSPVIVIEPGLGSPGAEWWLIQDELARMTTVVTYDRAGYGWSRPGRFPRTSFQVVNELSSMLQRADLTGPFVLIGHSQGGLYAQLFGRLYPDRVAGAVFLDPISSNHSRFRTELNPSVYHVSRIRCDAICADTGCAASPGTDALLQTLHRDESACLSVGPARNCSRGDLATLHPAEGLQSDSQ